MQSAYRPVAWEYWRMVWLFLHPVLPYRYVTWQGVRAFWILLGCTWDSCTCFMHPNEAEPWRGNLAISCNILTHRAGESTWLLWLPLESCWAFGDFLRRFHGLLGSRRFPTMPWDKRSPATATSDVWSSWWRRSFRWAQHAWTDGQKQGCFGNASSLLA